MPTYGVSKAVELGDRARVAWNVQRTAHPNDFAYSAERLGVVLRAKAKLVTVGVSVEK